MNPGGGSSNFVYGRQTGGFVRFLKKNLLEMALGTGLWHITFFRSENKPDDSPGNLHNQGNLYVPPN